MPAGRRARNVEFLNLLYELSGCSNISDFAMSCGQAQSNMTNFLKGNPSPGKRVLSRCLQALVATKSRPIPVCEICKIPNKQIEVPEKSGVYVLYDSGGNIVYVGKAKNFRSEVWQTLSREVPSPIRLGPDIHRKDWPKIRQLASYYSLYEVVDSILRTNLEALLLRAVTNQTHNTNLGHFI